MSMIAKVLSKSSEGLRCQLSDGSIVLAKWLGNSEPSYVELELAQSGALIASSKAALGGSLSKQPQVFSTGRESFDIGYPRGELFNVDVAKKAPVEALAMALSYTGGFESGKWLTRGLSIQFRDTGTLLDEDRLELLMDYPLDFLPAGDRPQDVPGNYNSIFQTPPGFPGFGPARALADATGREIVRIAYSAFSALTLRPAQLSLPERFESSDLPGIRIDLNLLYPTLAQQFSVDFFASFRQREYSGNGNGITYASDLFVRPVRLDGSLFTDFLGQDDSTRQPQFWPRLDLIDYDWSAGNLQGYKTKAETDSILDLSYLISPTQRLLGGAIPYASAQLVPWATLNVNLESSSPFTWEQYSIF